MKNYNSVARRGSEVANCKAEHKPPKQVSTTILSKAYTVFFGILVGAVIATFKVGWMSLRFDFTTTDSIQLNGYK